MVKIKQAGIHWKGTKKKHLAKVISQINCLPIGTLPFGESHGSRNARYVRKVRSVRGARTMLAFDATVGWRRRDRQIPGYDIRVLGHLWVSCWSHLRKRCGLLRCRDNGSTRSALELSRQRLLRLQDRNQLCRGLGEGRGVWHRLLRF